MDTLTPNSQARLENFPSVLPEPFNLYPQLQSCLIRLQCAACQALCCCLSLYNAVLMYAAILCLFYWHFGCLAVSLNIYEHGSVRIHFSANANVICRMAGPYVVELRARRPVMLCVAGSVPTACPRKPRFQS